MKDAGKYLWLAAVAFGITLAVLIVNRLDNQALAMLTGAICGMAAGIPMTVAIFLLTQRQKEERLKAQHEPREQPQPVIVVQPPPAAPGAPSWPAGNHTPLPPLARPPRDFNIVGDDEEDHGSA